MNATEILALFDRRQRQEIEYPDMRKEVLPHVTRFIRPAPGLSLLLHSRLNDNNADQVIQQQMADFTQMRLPFTWKVYAYDQPVNLGERLISFGFEPDSDPPDAVMILDLHAVPPRLAAPIQADVRQITHPEQMEDVIRVEQQVWGGSFEWIQARMGAHLQVPGYLSVFVAYVDGQPTCTGWTYYNLKGDFASLWGGSTVPDYRHKGLYTAVLAARVQEAIRRGYCFLTVDAGAMSGPILAQHGFQVLTHATTYDWKIEEG